MAISRITSQDIRATASAATINGVYPATPMQDSLLIASVYSNVTVGSNAIAGWSTALDKQIGNATASVSLFYKIAKAGESTTVTATSATATVMKLHIYEYVGNATQNVLDQTNFTNGGASTLSTQSTNSITTTLANELLFAVNGVSAAVTSPAWDSSFTLRQQDAAIRLFDGDQIVAATGTYSSNASWTTAVKTTTMIASFKAGTAPVIFNNYQSVKVGDGLSTGERIR